MKKTFKPILLFFILSFFIVSPVMAEPFWPPELNRPYPDLTLIDQTGQEVRIADFKGKLIFVEYVGMTCPACQAFSGAPERGAFEDIVPQAGLESIESYFPMYAGGIKLSDRRIVFIQIILYDMNMRAPQADDAKRWANHFGLNRSKNQIVLAGKPEFLGQASFNMIPGFQLIDRNFMLRADSTGHHPYHNLYTELLPMVPRLLRK